MTWTQVIVLKKRKQKKNRSVASADRFPLTEEQLLFGQILVNVFKAGKFAGNSHGMDGFLKGIRHFDLEKEDHPIITLPCDVQGAYREMSAFLDHLPQDFRMPTVFLSDLDYIALGAMTALKDHGYRIPEDISIIGYDDVSTAAVSSPPLTTLRVSQTEIGRIAANVLLNRLARNSGRSFTLRIPSELIIRGSVFNLK